MKPGGRLVYATCSVLDVEGEAVADDFERESGSAFVRVPRATLSSARASRVRSRWSRATGCACGPIAMQPMASSPRSGNVLEDAG